MIRRRAISQDLTSVFGPSMAATILVERLVATGDARLVHRLLKRFHKVTAAIAAVRRSIDDLSQRGWLEQLILQDTQRDLNARVPAEIAHRFYGQIRKAIAKPRHRPR